MPDSIYDRNGPFAFDGYTPEEAYREGVADGKREQVEINQLLRELSDYAKNAIGTNPIIEPLWFWEIVRRARGILGLTPEGHDVSR